jgi:hypothetical protein
MEGIAAELVQKKQEKRGESGCGGDGPGGEGLWMREAGSGEEGAGEDDGGCEGMEEAESEVGSGMWGGVWGSWKRAVVCFRKRYPTLRVRQRREGWGTRVRCLEGGRVGCRVGGVGLRVLPGVDEEAVEAAEEGEEQGRGQEESTEGGVARDGGDEDGGGEEDADGELFGETAAEGWGGCRGLG